MAEVKVEFEKTLEVVFKLCWSKSSNIL